MNKGLWQRFFTIFFVLALPFIFNGCGQDWNSYSGDAAFGDLAMDCSNPANAELCAAAEVLQSKCFSCHSNWAAFDSNQDYIDAGMVVAQDTANSPIINRLVNSGSNMPPSGGALPPAEYNALVTWVMGL